MIENRLAIYGPSECPICGNHKESVYAGRYNLTCRRHPGHPLFEAPASGGLTPTTQEPRTGAHRT